MVRRADETQKYRRRAARVVLLDGENRVLLFRLYLDHRVPQRGSYWLTPGGGVGRGEPIAVAAARELWEETGLRVDPESLGSPVAQTSGYAAFPWAKGVFREDFFFRVDSHEVSTQGFEPLERRIVTGYRWWTLGELESTTESVHPWDFAPLVAGLVAGRVPECPVRLTWHH